MIEISLIEQLCAFAEEGTLSAAAKKLLISQPALSRSMMRLEDELGMKLFERQKNRIALNDTGLLAAEYAKKVLEQERLMIESLRAHERSRHTVSMGSVGPGPVMHYQALLSQFFPDKTISSEVTTENALLDGLENGIYQLAFLSRPIERKGIFCTEAICERLNITVPTSHPAYALKSVSFRQMDGSTFLMFYQVGEWEAIVREKMPNARFILHHEYGDFAEFLQSSSLPGFSTNITLGFRNSSSGDRISVPFSDPDACIQFYLVCKEKDSARFMALLR